MKTKKKMNLQIDCEEISEMQKSIFSEIGNDGLRFIRHDVHIGPEGLMKINGDLISALLPTNKETMETINQNILGKGAACVVQEGVYKPLGIRVAIKSINIYDKNKRHQIMNDIRVLLASVVEEENLGYKCNFIVTLYGAYFDEGKVKVILELMDGGSLEDIIKLYRAAKVSVFIKETILAKIAIQMLCGISYLHSKNHIHRDIKPANILLNTQGEVKLSDFGISRQFLEGDQFSKTSIGTRTYMSPERIQGNSYSYKSDIWGFGLILYELATGVFPYDNRSEFDLIKDFQTKGSPILPQSYSQDLQNFFDKSLAIDENNRFDALELLGHPWMIKNINSKTNLTSWLAQIKNKIVPILTTSH